MSERFVDVLTRIESELPDNLIDKERDFEFFDRIEKYFGEYSVHEVKYAHLTWTPKVLITSPTDNFCYQTYVKRHGKWVEVEHNVFDAEELQKVFANIFSELIATNTEDSKLFDSFKQRVYKIMDIMGFFCVVGAEYTDDCDPKTMQYHFEININNIIFDCWTSSSGVTVEFDRVI